MIERKRTRDNSGILSCFLCTNCQNPGYSTPLLVPFPRAIPPEVSCPATVVAGAASTNGCGWADSLNGLRGLDRGSTVLSGVSFPLAICVFSAHTRDVMVITPVATGMGSSVCPAGGWSGWGWCGCVSNRPQAHCLAHLLQAGPYGCSCLPY